MERYQSNGGEQRKLNREERLALLNAILQSITLEHTLFAPSNGALWKEWGMQSEKDWKQRVTMDKRNAEWALSQYKSTLRAAYRIALEFAEQEEVSRCD